jgi:hypothetical protein
LMRPRPRCGRHCGIFPASRVCRTLRDPDLRILTSLISRMDRPRLVTAIVLVVAACLSPAAAGAYVAVMVRPRAYPV